MKSTGRISSTPFLGLRRSTQSLPSSSLGLACFCVWRSAFRPWAYVSAQLPRVPSFVGFLPPCAKRDMRPINMTTDPAYNPLATRQTPCAWRIIHRLLKAPGEPLGGFPLAPHLKNPKTRVSLKGGDQNQTQESPPSNWAQKRLQPLPPTQLHPQNSQQGCSSAFFLISGTSLAPSASYKESPMSTPASLMKVKAMPRIPSLADRSIADRTTWEQ